MHKYAEQSLHTEYKNVRFTCKDEYKIYIGIKKYLRVWWN